MNSKIKVLQVIPKLGYGGAETGCYDLAHFLSENNCRSYLITSGGPLLKYIKKDKVKLFKLPVHSKNPLLMILNSIFITLIILFFNISIVHARSRAPAWSCLLATKLTRRKFVTTFHGTYNFNNSLKKFYNSVMVRSDLVIAGSNFIFSHICENYEKYLNNKNRKLLVIFRGINSEYFSQKNVSNAKLQKQIKEWKGQIVFIEALNILNQQTYVKPFSSIILGSDQDRKIYYKKLISLVEKYRLTQIIKFVPFCKEMPLAYKLADVVVSASIEPEAFGRVSVEAQSMEIPIIASDIGGSKETILKDKSGLFFKSGDPISLVEKLKEILNFDDSTLKNVLKKFDIEKMCNSTIAEYKKLIN